ncbi:hypothetical protein [Kordia sp.]|uniref:hypothetical protein n=1 Tax=Kordia sp. TaxID=1965332 RepID=UPI003D6A5361
MSIKLNPSKLTLTISLKEEDEERMQLVYASQLYQTFFAVFASFDIDRTDPNLLKLKGVYLELINYKGIINLGIVGILDPIFIDNGIEIKLKIKALHESGVLKYYKFTSPKIIKNNTDSQINFARVLEPIANNHITGTNENHIFDSEFFERDGLFNRKKIRRLEEEDDDDFEAINQNNLQLRYSNPSVLRAPALQNRVKENYIHGVEVKIESPPIDKAPGGRCPKSINIVTY